MTLMQKLYWLMATVGNGLAIWLCSHHPGLGSWLLLAFTLGYTLIGAYDLFLSRHSLNRLYPVVAYIRYGLESFRVEIQQYFIASDTEEKPFNREERSLVYQRSKSVRDTIAFGTQRDLLADNYLSLWHSLSPCEVKEDSKRVRFGGDECVKPYSASDRKSVV